MFWGVNNSAQAVAISTGIHEVTKHFATAWVYAGVIIYLGIAFVLFKIGLNVLRGFGFGFLGGQEAPLPPRDERPLPGSTFTPSVSPTGKAGSEGMFHDLLGDQESSTRLFS